MSILIPRKSKPPTSNPSGDSYTLNYQNPLTVGLSEVLIPTAEGLQGVKHDEFYSESSGNIKAKVGDHGYCVYSDTQHPDEIRLDSADQTTGTWQEPTNQVTVVVALKRTGAAAGNAPIFGNQAPSTAPFNSYNIVDISGAGNLAFEFATTVNGAKIITDTSGISDNKHHVCIGRYDGANGELFNNGVSVGTIAATGDIDYFSSTARGPAVGNYFDFSGSRSFVGEIYLCALYSRALSDDEVLSISENPYQILKPRRKYWVLPSEAALNNNRISAMHFQRHYEPIAMGD